MRACQDVFNGKIAIVTGAATGIGSATARLFADHGAQVLAADIKEPGDVLAAALTDKADALAFSRLDVRARSGPGCRACGGQAPVRTARRPRQQRRPRSAAASRCTRRRPEAMRASFEINVIGMLLGMKTVVPGMIAARRRGGRQRLVGLGLAGVANNVAYQTAKAAAMMLSKNAGVTYAPHGIRVNCVLPGYVDTPMSRTVTPTRRRSC